MRACVRACVCVWGGWGGGGAAGAEKERCRSHFVTIGTVLLSRPRVILSVVLCYGIKLVRSSEREAADPSRNQAEAETKSNGRKTVDRLVLVCAASRELTFSRALDVSISS